MANVSVNFNTATDSLDDILATVEHIFDMSSTLAANAPAPAAAVVQNLATPAASPEPANFDAAGLPWDGRIHAASKAITGKGVWRAKVGIDPQVKLAVENELRAANPNTAQPVAAAPVAAAPVAAAPVAAAPVAAAPAMPSIPNMPALPVMAETSFQKLSRFIAEQVQAGSINNDWVAQALAAYNVPGGLLPNAAGMPDADVGQILAGFKAALGVA